MDLEKVAVRLAYWGCVRLIEINEFRIRVFTERGSNFFEFSSQDEARTFLERWFPGGAMTLGNSN